ncbi:MAG: hypothetical protein AAGK25_11015 [Pseudomonadota bacterium]
MKAQTQSHILYKDRRFTITPADIRTRTAFYPVTDTVGRVRRDILFAALGFAAIISVGMWRYYDLWTHDEKIVMGVIIALTLLIGTQLSMLQLDARGFPSRIWIARSSTVNKIFDAITKARATNVSAGGGIDPDYNLDGEY